MQAKLQFFLESKWFNQFIIAVIIINAITLGLETEPERLSGLMPILTFIDKVCLGIFTVELLAKLAVYRTRFFRDGWNIFDFIIVAASYLPFIDGLSVLRALRILRVLRIISVVPQFRKIIQAFFDSLSGIAVVASLLLIVFYIGAVMTTKLFGASFPDWFGSIPKSLYSLFQIMTLESWSMGIVRPVMEIYPYAWMFFVPFILATTFVVLNLLIGVIVNSLQKMQDDTKQVLTEELSKQDHGRKQLQEQLEAVEKAIAELKRRL